MPSVTLRHPFPQKCPSREEVVFPFTTSYLRHNPPTTPNGISIDSAVFAKYTFVTNGQKDTDRQYGRGT